MSHMQPEITGKEDWFVLTHNGEDTVHPADAFNLSDMVEGDTLELKVGYGVRLSAPGYLDCTDWHIAASEKEAEDYLIENHDYLKCVKCGDMQDDPGFDGDADQYVCHPCRAEE